jgi:N-acetylneuraminic acid mutarotase
VAGSQPVSRVTLQVSDEQYSALLGYTGLPNMMALPQSVLSYLNARVRVWYLLPGRTSYTVAPLDAPLNNVPYAEQASFSTMAGGVPNGSITGASLAAGTITADKLAPAVLGSLTSGLQASLSPNDPTLTAQGLSKVQTLPGGTWSPSTASSAPSPRSGHTAIWTGSSMIVWGGTVSSLFSNQGGEYNAAAQTWSLLSTTNAPSPRSGHTAVWTGSQMIVWGGATSANPGGDASGGVFNDANQAWQAMSTFSAPSARTADTAVWTGSQMIVWGGNSPFGARADGGAYTAPISSVDQGSWTVIPASAVAGVRQSHTAVWTGTAMLIWGGLDGSLNPLDTGASYNPATGVWTALPTLNAPTARFGHSAIWTGSTMIVFGGINATVGGQLLNDGAIYDPVANTWTPLPSVAAPDPRTSHGAVWTGSEMLVFSGQGASSYLLSAGAFKPATNAWRSLPAAPAGATQMAGVWSGTLLLSFGLGGLDTLDPSPTLYLYGKF